MKHILSISMLFLFALTAISQTTNVSGKTTPPLGKGISDVSIVIKDATIEITTYENSDYSLNIE